MFLSQLGFTTSRRQAFGLFNLKRNNPDYSGATHSEIGNIFARVTGIESWRWQYYRRFDFASISGALRLHLRVNRRPTLLSFGAIHKNGEWKCTHVAVVVGASCKMIELLDPLCKSPRSGTNANVLLRAANRTCPVSVTGGSYSINHESQAAIFCWTVKEQL